MSFPPGTPGPDQPPGYQPSDYPPTQPGYPQPGYPQPGYPPTQPGYQPTQPGIWPPAQPVPGTAPVPTGPAAVAPSGEPVLVSIGDITVTPTRVYTPSGSQPLTDVQWSLTDLTVSSQEIPTWAIVCAVVFFLFCFLGLLFLLAKESVTRGSVQVSVYGPGFAHSTQVPVSSLAQVADLNARVNYARTLAAASLPPGVDQPPNQAPGGAVWPESGQGT